MNRNVEAHFSNIPNIDVQRSVFDRSSTHKTSFNVGDVIPIYVDEVLPGDTFDMSTSKVVRLQTLLDPIMDNIYLDTYFFFIPNRLTWFHWKQFCGQNDSSAWAPSVDYRVPVQKSPAGGFWAGSLADYFGLPLGVEFNETDPLAPSALPFRAYVLCMNEFFRDQNLQVPLAGGNADSNDSSVTKDEADRLIDNPGQQIWAGYPFKAAKYHDYFTSCLPAPQKHDPVSFSFETEIPSIPVIAKADSHSMINGRQVLWRRVPESGAIPPSSTEPASRLISLFFSSEKAGENAAYLEPRTGANSNYSYAPVNLWTAGKNDPGYPGDMPAATFSVNDLRIAFQLQKFYERCARGGTRYSEFIKSQFGTDVPDARVQRPEYLGGNRIALSVHEVTNNSQSELDFLGDLGAMSVTADHHSDFIHSFTEHGLILGLAVARYDHSYNQGLERFWTRKSLTDFYLPVFANIGEQPVYKAEIFATSENMANKEVFGYQEAWADYRYKPNRVSGEMRPQHPQTLASWHLSDNYAQAPTLSGAWIQEDKTNVDRVLAVSSSVSNQIFADFYFNCKTTRPMPMYSIPGLIDHN